MRKDQVRSAFEIPRDRYHAIAGELRELAAQTIDRSVWTIIDDPDPEITFQGMEVWPK